MEQFHLIKRLQLRTRASPAKTFMICLRCFNVWGLPRVGLWRPLETCFPLGGFLNTRVRVRVRVRLPWASPPLRTVRTLYVVLFQTQKSGTYSTYCWIVWKGYNLAPPKALTTMAKRRDLVISRREKKSRRSAAQIQQLTTHCECLPFWMIYLEYYCEFIIGFNDR